jgi:electron-transferring-flavoprotein dehydrogenase
VGLVLGLDYADPRLDPFDEFQRWKAHPVVREVLAGGKLLMFGAKCLPEGGYDALPPLYADGVLLVGDAAGVLNPARLQGAHLAMQSGIAAAEALAEAWPRGDFSARVLRRYEEVLLGSWVGAELRAFRHWRAAYGRGLWRGRLQDVLRRVGLENALPAAICDLRLAIERPSRDGNAATQSPIANRQSAIPCLAAVPQTPCADADTLAPMRHFPGPRWPGPATPDGPLVLDRAAATAHSGASHREGQPLHLLVLDAELCQRCVAEFAGPCQRVCPSGVYEWECGPDGGGSAGILPATEAGWKPALRGRLLVHAANCLHCKACAIKDPYGNILWKAPEGGGGPKYRGM